MANSMTGFARSVTDLAGGRMTLEVRTVNHRYLEATFRLPERLRFSEAALREQVRQSVARGKVELTVRWQEGGNEAESAAMLTLDVQRLEALQQAVHQVRLTVPDAGAPDALAVLAWPGVLAEPRQDDTALANAVQTCLDEALVQLQSNRHREGEAMAVQISQRLEEVSAIVSQLRAAVPALQAHLQQRLQARLASLGVDNIDPERLAQEVALLAQKADVAEELDRLDAHVTETRGVLERHEPIGRRLDFLMQEFNREANTLASKAAQSEHSQAAIDLKVLIEQMREQIQNLE